MSVFAVGRAANMRAAAASTAPPKEKEKVKSIIEILQCPVCDELPVPPVFGCQNGHIVCNSCKNLVQHCPVCRAEKFNVRNVIAEDVLTSRNFCCPYKDYGCQNKRMNGAEYTAHVKICDCRPIECHCKTGFEECYGRLIAPDEYLDHMMEYHGSKPAISIHTVKCDMVGSFVPCQFSYLGKQFLVQSVRDDNKFWTWVAVDQGGANGQDPQFYLKLTLRYFSGNQEITFSSEMIPPKSLRDTPGQVLKSGHCLEFTAETAPPTMPPYVWPGYYVVEGEENGFFWGYDVEIHKAQDRRAGKQAKTARRIDREVEMARRHDLEVEMANIRADIERLRRQGVHHNHSAAPISSRIPGFVAPPPVIPPVENLGLELGLDQPAVVQDPNLPVPIPVGGQLNADPNGANLPGLIEAANDYMVSSDDDEDDSDLSLSDSEDDLNNAQNGDGQNRGIIRKASRSPENRRARRRSQPRGRQAPRVGDVPAENVAIAMDPVVNGVDVAVGTDHDDEEAN